MFGHFDNQAHAALVKKEFEHCECHASPSPRVLTAFCRVRRRLISADVAILQLCPIDATSRGSMCSKYYGRNQRPSTRQSTPATRHVSNTLFSIFSFVHFIPCLFFLPFFFPGLPSLKGGSGLSRPFTCIGNRTAIHQQPRAKPSFRPTFSTPTLMLAV